MLCHLKELGKGSKMLKTVPRYDKRILSYGYLKTFKVSPRNHTFLLKTNLLIFFVQFFPCKLIIWKNGLLVPKNRIILDFKFLA